MFINFEECMQLREAVTALQTRFQNLSGQVALAMWQMQYNPV